MDTSAAVLERPTVSAEPQGSPSAMPRLKILAIDDDKSFRDMLREFLIVLGHEVVSASDGIEGLEIFSRNKDAFDLILLDYYMPKMNGAQTFQCLRKIQPAV